MTGPHSIYFQMLGEQGFVGLGLFLLLLGSCWFSLRKIQRRAHEQPSQVGLENYSKMLQTSLLAYMVSGAFLALAYFDLLYQLVAATIILKILYRRQAEAALQQSEVEPMVAAGIGEPAPS